MHIVDKLVFDEKLINYDKLADYYKLASVSAVSGGTCSVLIIKQANVGDGYDWLLEICPL